MRQDAKTRREQLDALRQQLHRPAGIRDDKLQKLVRARCLNESAKVIVFVEMHPTALYLEAMLGRIFRDRLRVACTVRKGKDGPRLKQRGESEDISLEGNVKIEELLRHFDVPGDTEGEVSLPTHPAVLEQYRTRAESLRHTLHSARYSPIPEPRVFVLIKHAGRHHLVVFDPVQDRVESGDEFAVLNFIRCEVGEERAGVAVRDILRAADRAVQVWCEHGGVDLTNAERVCALYLQPADRVRDLDPLLVVK